MTSWTAIIPFKKAQQRKTRLAQSLSPIERARISHHMMMHVARIVSSHRAIDEVVLVSESAPSDWIWSWIRDEGRGLNTELQDARLKIQTSGTLVIHADLPLLDLNDVDALIAGASSNGIAIAPDRHGTGTNAIALKREVDFDFRFGAGSYALHRLQEPLCNTVIREGTGFDLDTPNDLNFIQENNNFLDLIYPKIFTY